MKTAPKIVERLKTEGVTIIPGIISREEAAVARSLLEKAVIDEHAKWSQKPGYVDNYMVHNLMLHGAPFVRLLENDIIHAYLSEVLSPTCILYAYTSSSMPPGGSNFARRVHVDSPRVVPGYWMTIGLMVALDDFTAENGATSFLPRSFERTDLPSEAEFDANSIKLYPKAGDGIMFNARVWHRGGVNTTDRTRHAVTMSIVRAYMKQRFDYPRLVPAHIIDSLGPVGRRFIGMDTRIPTSLDEYYVPEDQRLYKSGQG